MEPLLHINNLQKCYANQTHALHGIHVDIQEGEFIVMIGPSGAGKSTFLRSINRLIEPSDGDVVLLGKDMSKMNKKQLRLARGEIGMIFQNYNLIERSSVLENVLHGNLSRMNTLDAIRNHYSNEMIETAMRLLEEVGLKEKAYVRCDELSGGQKQRVGICRALAQNPKVILADEPIASLDPKSSRVVMDKLHEACKKRGIACIINLHQVDFAKAYASRILGLHGGKLVFDGTPEELDEAWLTKIYNR